MVTIGYARVSTQDQAYKIALSQQVFRLTQAGAVRVYADIGSRTKDDRSALLEVMRLIASGEVDRVIVTRLDRVTSSPGLFEQLSALLVRHSVVLEALDETVDVHSVDGEFTAGLSVYFARREVRTIQMRIKKSKEVGRMHNRASSSVPWGYRNVDGRYELDHTPYLCLISDRPPNGENFSGRTKAELGRDVIDLFFAGGSLSQATRLIHQKYGICKFKSRRQEKSSLPILIFEEGIPTNTPTINKRAGIFRWSPDGMRLYLLNPVLCGHTPYHTHYIHKDGRTGGRKPISQFDVRPNTHPDQRLITDEEKRQIEQMMEWNGRGGKWGPGKTYPLTGIIVCGECGRSMKCQGIKRVREHKVYYQCKNYIQRACTSRKMVRFDEVEPMVIQELLNKASAIATVASRPDTYVESPELIQLKNQLAGLEKLGNNPAIDAAKIELRHQIELLKYKFQQDLETNLFNRELLLRTFSDRYFWKTMNDEDKRNCYQNLVERVVVRDGQVERVELKYESENFSNYV